jgi:hypothetical protein
VPVTAMLPPEVTASTFFTASLNALVRYGSWSDLFCAFDAMLIAKSRKEKKEIFMFFYCISSCNKLSFRIVNFSKPHAPGISWRHVALKAHHIAVQVAYESLMEVFVPKLEPRKELVDFQHSTEF